jgi:multidrug efflux pump subunit AcrB
MRCAFTITADVVKDVVTPLNASAMALDGIDLDADWPGMRVVIGSEAQETSDSMGSLVVAFIASTIGIPDVGF